MSKQPYLLPCIEVLVDELCIESLQLVYVVKVDYDSLFTQYLECVFINFRYSTTNHYEIRPSFLHLVSLVITVSVSIYENIASIGDSSL